MNFFLKMEVYPRPLHHDDACGPFIKYPKSSNKKVLQLANGAETKHKGLENRSGQIQPVR